MINDNINIYTTIASMDGYEKYKLTALLNYSDNIYEMPSLEIISSNGQEVFWDSNTYLFVTLYGLIKLWVTEKKVEDGEEFSEVVKIIPLDDWPVIYELLEQGLKLGFYGKIQ
jgi:predicted ribosome-associated RNA-binding protein Tma20